MRGKLSYPKIVSKPADDNRFRSNTDFFLNSAYFGELRNIYKLLFTPIPKIDQPTCI